MPEGPVRLLALADLGGVDRRGRRRRSAGRRRTATAWLVGAAGVRGRPDGDRPRRRRRHARGVQRPDGRPRVRRRRLVDARLDRLLRELGRPAPVPAGRGGRAGRDHAGAGDPARPALRRRDRDRRRQGDHLRPRDATSRVARRSTRSSIFPTDGSVEPDDIVSGNDFYSNPRLSPDGTKLAWLEWTHPNLPWDGTFLYVGDLTDEYGIRNARSSPAAMDESIYQPQWARTASCTTSPTAAAGGTSTARTPIEPVVAMDADFGAPQWVFGGSRYVFMDDGDIVCVCHAQRARSLGVIRDGKLEELDLPYSTMTTLTTRGRPGAVHRGEPDGAPAARVARPDDGSDRGAQAGARRRSGRDVHLGRRGDRVRERRTHARTRSSTRRATPTSRARTARSHRSSCSATADRPVRSTRPSG